MMFRNVVAVTGAALLLTIVACDNDPAKGVPEARATAAQPVRNEPAKGATKYTFSAAGSKVEFTGAKVTGKHDGSFGEFTGTIDLAGSDPSKGSVTVEVSTASLQSDSEKLTGHLKSKDFFDVATFPKAKFTSTAIQAGGTDGATHTVTGNLELHGQTKSITFPATIGIQGDRVTVKADFAINRKDFGIVYPGMPDDLIKDEVLIRLSIDAKK